MSPQKTRRATELIVIHASMTPPDLDVGLAYLDKRHRALGFLRCGYHYVIRRDGSVEAGRPVDDCGAHCFGVNDRSVAICMVGGDDNDGMDGFTAEQVEALRALVTNTQARYPEVKHIVGHRDLDGSTRCPCFDVRNALKGILTQ